MIKVIETRTGAEFSGVPPLLRCADTGEAINLEDPAVVVDRVALSRWLVAAWHYLTGESPQGDSWAREHGRSGLIDQ